MLTIDQLYNKILCPTVRVRTGDRGGSGTVIYSQPRNLDDADEYSTFVLTNHHVIDPCIRIEEQWDTTIGRKMEKEVRVPCDVEIFHWARGKVQSSESMLADVVMWNDPHDLALLELRSIRQVEHVAEMLPIGEVRNLRLFMPVRSCGCTLGHDPLPSNPGCISSLDEMISNLGFWMTNVSIAWGNSGGGCYLEETGQWIGIPSRMDVVPQFFSADAMTFLNYIIPISRVFDVVSRDWHYEFLFPWTGVSREESKRRREVEMDELKRAWERQFREEIGRAVGGATADTGKMYEP